MSTTFSSPPIVDLSPLQNPSELSEADRLAPSTKLYNVFATTGFAYLVNAPLTFKYVDVFGLALEFFSLPLEEKMKLARRHSSRRMRIHTEGSLPRSLMESN